MTSSSILRVGIVVLLLAVVGAIVGIVLSVGTGSSAENKSQDDKADDLSKKANESQPKRARVKFADISNDSSAALDEYTTDPLDETYSVTALAIGDWGRTVAKAGGSCCQRRKSYTVQDFNAMEYTATLLGLAAASMTPRPSVIIGHGDNFYWTGLQGVSDQAYRFQETFESKYADPALHGIPWVNVMGNHDFGGASFVCSDGEYTPTKCGSTAELLTHLATKFTLQSQYVSPQENRWIMPDRFFVHSLQGGASSEPGTAVTVDVFNMDTNDADTHGASQICCQCYGYSGGDDDQCEEVTRGHSYCAGGDTGMYDACMDQLQAWSQESRVALVSAANASTATWKLVNTHYSPYNHYRPEQADAWHALLKNLGIDVFMYGHTHGEKHDYSSFQTHFIENGAGGGIQNESPSGIPPYAEDYIENLWAAGHYPYGIFALRMSPTWLQVQFMTFDSAWVMNEDVTATVVGGIDVRHCWYIPQGGGRGMSCETAEERHATATPDADADAATATPLQPT